MLPHSAKTEGRGRRETERRDATDGERGGAATAARCPLALLDSRRLRWPPRFCSSSLDRPRSERRGKGKGGGLAERPLPKMREADVARGEERPRPWRGGSGRLSKFDTGPPEEVDLPPCLPHLLAPRPCSCDGERRKLCDGKRGKEREREIKRKKK